MYLYHATYTENQKSIEKDGLIPGKKSNFEGMIMHDAVYLAFSPETALCYAENSDYFCGSDDCLDIVVFKVAVDSLDSSKIGYDWNNLCEYEEDINSIAYHAGIPAKDLTLITNKEINDTPDHHLINFKGTDLYWRIGQVFDEEVATNKENII